MSPTESRRPPDLASGDGGVAAQRAMVRWAWRLFRREWRQQLLVLSLITVAVAATILGAAVGTNTPPPVNAGFGSANHLVSLPASDPHLASDLAAIKDHFGTVDVLESESLATGLVAGAQLDAADPNGPYAGPMFVLVSGAYPHGAGEVAMSRPLASTLGLAIGDLWHESGRSLRVVGLVENTQNLLDSFALVPPGQLSSPSQVTVLFDASAASAAAFTFPPDSTPLSPPTSNGISPAVIVFVFAVFGLIFIGLVAVAGFTVLAQRRLRALGMLSALGATDHHVRLVMVANGAVVGLVGALAGAVIGFAAWIAYAPHLATSANHSVVWSNLPWWLIGTAMALAVVTATLASRRPARSVAHIPVVAALSGRPAPAKAVHRSALPGVVLLVVGPLMLASSGGWGGNGGSDLLFLLGGLVATAVGLLLLAPFCVMVLGLLARGAPLGPRLALRDLGRYRARSGSALAATSLAVLIAMLVALIAGGRYANVLDYFGPNLPANELVVYAPGNGPGGGGGPGPGPGGSGAPSLRAMRSHVDAIAASLDSRDVLVLEEVNIQLQDGAQGSHGNIYVATPSLLEHYGIRPGEIDPTTLLVTSRGGLEGMAGLQILQGPPEGNGCVAPGCVADPKTQTFSNLPADTSDPNLLVTAYAVHVLHLSVGLGGWLVQAPRKLSAAQINGARQSAAAAGMTVETKSDDPSLAQLRNWATAAGILLALGVLAMTVGLIRSESAGDLRTLSATGAGSRTRRTIAGATAGALGLLGAVLGTAVAYLATVAFFRSEIGELMRNIPVLDLVLVLLGLPVVAAAGGWLFAGRQPPAVARQPLE